MQQSTNDLASILSPLSSRENMPLLLEVLTVIPTEVSKSYSFIYIILVYL